MPVTSEQGVAVARLDIEPLASTLVSCLEGRFRDILVHEIRRTELALPTAPHSAEGLRIVEDPVFVDPGYENELMSFSGRKFNKFSCPEQAMGVQLASQQWTHFAVHSATGSGKSLIWMFPSFLWERKYTTIVISPYRALLQDMKDRCNEHMLTSEIWTSSNPQPGHTPVLLVLIDQVPHHLFMAHVRYLKSTNKVARIILDEPQALVASQKYRPVMKQLTVLAEMGIQIGLLSATLPPGIVPPLMHMLGIRHLHVIRGCTARQNLAYHRHLFKSSAQLRMAVVSLAKDLILAMTSEERGFIICRTKADSVYFSEALEAECYNSDVTPEEQIRILQRFRSTPKPSRTIACTTGLTQGVHMAHARWSIHAGLPYDMVDAIQSLGRIGRDQRLAHCHIMALHSQCVQVEDGVEEGDVLGVAAMRRTVSQHQLCVQEQLTGFNDGRALSCGALNSVLCDRCEALGMLRTQAGGPCSVSGFHPPLFLFVLKTPSR